MEICVENEMRKNELEDELRDARTILRAALCKPCKDKLSMKVKERQNEAPSKKKGAISLHGKGNAFIISIVAVSVAMACLYNPSTGQNFVAPKQFESAIQFNVAANQRRGLAATSYDQMVDKFEGLIQVKSDKQQEENSAFEELAKMQNFLE